MSLGRDLLLDLKIVTRWTDSPDGNGNPVVSSKFFEIHFRGSDAIWVGPPTGVGYPRVQKHP